MTSAVAALLSARLGNGNRAALGRAAGIERTMLSRMLDGKKAITVDELAAICRALGTTPQAVITAALATPADSLARPAAHLRDTLAAGEAVAGRMLTQADLDAVAESSAAEILRANRVGSGPQGG